MLDKLQSEYDEEFETKRLTDHENALYIGKRDWVVITRTGDTFSIMFKKYRVAGTPDEQTNATIDDVEETVEDFIEKLKNR